MFCSAAHRPTIASTVKMSQAAVDKMKKIGSQTQGDKLNQIKAMRSHQHNSRLSAGLR